MNLLKSYLITNVYKVYPGELLYRVRFFLDVPKDGIWFLMLFNDMGYQFVLVVFLVMFWLKCAKIVKKIRENG